MMVFPSIDSIVAASTDCAVVPVPRQPTITAAQADSGSPREPIRLSLSSREGSVGAAVSAETVHCNRRAIVRFSRRGQIKLGTFPDLICITRQTPEMPPKAEIALRGH
jgi:hypothetical protein